MKRDKYFEDMWNKLLKFRPEIAIKEFSTIQTTYGTCTITIPPSVEDLMVALGDDWTMTKNMGIYYTVLYPNSSNFRENVLKSMLGSMLMAYMFENHGILWDDAYEEWKEIKE